MRRTALPARPPAGVVFLVGMLLSGTPVSARGGPPPDAAPRADSVAVAPAPSRLFLARAQEGPWLRADRALHFGGSLAMAASWRVAGRGGNAAFGLSFGAGLAKEVYDATLKPGGRGRRGASRRDLIADVLGAAAGVLLLAALDR